MKNDVKVIFLCCLGTSILGFILKYMPDNWGIFCAFREYSEYVTFAGTVLAVVLGYLGHKHQNNNIQNLPQTIYQEITQNTNQLVLKETHNIYLFDVTFYALSLAKDHSLKCSDIDKKNTKFVEIVVRSLHQFAPKYFDGVVMETGEINVMKFYTNHFNVITDGEVLYSKYKRSEYKNEVANAIKRINKRCDMPYNYL